MNINMLALAAILALSLWLGNTLYQTAPRQPAMPAEPATQQQASVVPAFTFTAQDGTKHAMSDFAGKNVILNFWASWCAPCVSEFPLLLSFAASRPDTVLVALSSDKDPQAIRRFLEKLPSPARRHLARTNIIIAHDPGQAITNDLFQTVSLPETIIIDAQQQMKTKLVGAITSPETLKNALRQP